MGCKSNLEGGGTHERGYELNRFSEYVKLRSNRVTRGAVRKSSLVVARILCDERRERPSRG